MTFRFLTTLAATILVAACSGGNGGGGNRAAPNEAPTISALADQSVEANRSIGPLDVSIADEDVDNLQITVSADNPGLLPVDSILLAGSGARRSLTLTPVADTLGESRITVTVTDTLGLSATRTFRLLVTPQQRSLAAFFSEVFLLAADAEPVPVNALELTPDLGPDEIAAVISF